MDTNLEIKDARIKEKMLDLCQSIFHLLPDQDSRVVQFIGCHRGEGTSTLVRNFAAVAANTLGVSVLLLDADRPAEQFVHFKITPESGWADAVRGECSVFDLATQVGESKLFVSQMFMNGETITLDPNASRIDSFITELRKRFSLILIDSPPATSSTFGMSLSHQVDGIVLIVEAENTRWQVLHNIKAKLENQGGKILGVILNKRRHYIPRFIYRRL